MLRVVTIVVLASLLSACASSSNSKSRIERYIDRALANAPGEAQPGKIVATEIGFAKMAREEGQWTAFRQFAAAGAQLHFPDGTTDAATWLAARPDPPAAAQWETRSVWMSCDGALAVSFGRYRDPQAQLGHYATVWLRQADESYRFVYEGGALDDPQPAPMPDQPAPLEDEIVVAGIDSIAGIVADCPAEDAPLTAAPVADTPAGVSTSTSQSRDGTLRWRWEHHGEGKYRVVASYWTYNGWQTPLDVTFPMSIGE